MKIDADPTISLRLDRRKSFVIIASFRLCKG